MKIFDVLKERFSNKEEKEVEENMTEKIEMIERISESLYEEMILSFDLFG